MNLKLASAFITSRRARPYGFRSLLLGAVAVSLISCSRTGAQNGTTAAPAATGATQTASTITPTASIATPAASTASRALWVWDAKTIIDPQLGQSLLELCERKGIKTVFLATGSAFMEDPERSRVQVPLPALAAFLQKAHAQGLLVHTLDGDPGFALQKQHARVLGRLQRVLAYNAAAAPDARIDGYQWDTEPYLLAEWKTDEANQPGILRQYLDSAREMADAVKADTVKRAGGEFSLGYAIPAWWDNPARAMEWDGTTKPPAFHLLDVLNTAPGSYVALMSYRDKALGKNGTVAISQDEVDYAQKNAPAVKVWIGQETLDLKEEPASLTFYQEDEAALETAIAQIDEAFKAQPVVAGVAIHHWVSYVDLISRDVLTIETPQTHAQAMQQTTVSGTVKDAKPGQKIQISVKPDGDIWYTQQEAPIGNDGKWSATARIGNDKTRPGTGFAIRAELKDAAGTTIGSRTVMVKRQAP